MLMALDQFVFQLDTVPFSDLQRATAWRHPGNSRIGAREARQFIGPGDDTITLTGTLAPEVAGSLASLAQLRDMADAGEAYAMVDGSGRVLGAWVITDMHESGEAFTRDGRARVTRFTLTLAHADDDQVRAPQAADVPGASLGTIDADGAGMGSIA